MTSQTTVSPDELRRAVPALAHLSDDAMWNIARSAVARRFEKGATLYRIGDPADGLYLLLSGRVRVARGSAERQMLLHAEEAGGVLGEIPVFGGGPFPATAIATLETRCAYLPIAAVDRLLREEPQFARFALHRIAHRAQSLLRRIDELTATTVADRVRIYVLGRAGAVAGKEFILGMSQEALAHELGTAREVVVRALRALVESGAIIRTGRSRFVVGSSARRL